jgi:hypothetical protein
VRDGARNQFARRISADAREQHMNRKTFAEVKLGTEPGTFKARIATLNVVDHHGDVTLAGAAPDGKRILIGSFNHSSVVGNALPAGEAVVSSDAKAIYVSGRFWLDTEAGKQHYLVAKNAGAAGEWSYAYEATDYSKDLAELKQWGPSARRILKGLDIFEASLVFQGAGINTGTVLAKSDDMVALYEESMRILARGIEILKVRPQAYVPRGQDAPPQTSTPAMQRFPAI